MAGKGGARKGAGRPKGKPNADKQALLDLIRESVKVPDYHPVVEMARIACADTSEWDPEKQAAIEQIKFNANKEVARYVAPQLKAIEVQGTGDDGAITVVVKRFSASGD